MDRKKKKEEKKEKKKIWKQVSFFLTNVKKNENVKKDDEMDGWNERDVLLIDDDDTRLFWRFPLRVSARKRVVVVIVVVVAILSDSVYRHPTRVEYADESSR